MSTCPICYNEILTSTGKTTLSCNHEFHLRCISTWLQRNLSCPCCRSTVSQLEDCNESRVVHNNNNINDDDVETLSVHYHQSNLYDSSESLPINNQTLNRLSTFYAQNISPPVEPIVIPVDLFISFSICTRGAISTLRPLNALRSLSTFEYFEVYLFLLGLYKKRDHEFAFLHLWERLHMRFQLIDALSVLSEDDFFSQTIRDHVLITQSSPQSVLRFIFNPHVENALNNVLLGRSEWDDYVWEV